MSTVHSIQTIFEALICLLLLYGFVHEDKVIAFEQACKRIVMGHYRRFKRKLRKKVIRWLNAQNQHNVATIQKPVKNVS